MHLYFFFFDEEAGPTPPDPTPIGASNPGGGGGGGGRRESPEVSREIDRTLRKMLRAARRGEPAEDAEQVEEAAQVAAVELERISDAVADISKIARALVPPLPKISVPPVPIYVAPMPVAPPVSVAPDFSNDDEEVLMLLYG